ncbi:MAG: 5-methyltetrahydrofolate--homocysteine methyltransferase [Flavobacteriales bacterium MED-G22]|nr:homocysteine S-methyltransferase family protein [Flavobacteriaceae bacterium]PDH44047.1 MAG: 5-methyltetrahydrofolate--homocysteine methyltransferase [Flavobacteriales bacterium MED-G22]|tara:strand:+ start:184 stop:1194 length:1011 start_codon:yes stop_codon:yes gene_type:complete
MNKIREIIKERILVLDGAMGTMIQSHKLKEEDYRGLELKDHPMPLLGNNDLLSVTQPEIIKGVHRAYLEVGADIIETNTFSSTSIGMSDYGLEEWVHKINYESAKIAKEVANEYNILNPKKPRFVAGSIGPTNKTASMSPDVNQPGFRAVDFDELVLAYSEQIVGLKEGGVDLLLIETVFDTLNAKAALFAVSQIKEQQQWEVPVMLSGTITDASGRTLSGQTVGAFYISLQHMDLLSIGFNCALGADQLLPYVKELSMISNSFISAHPNAGLPNAFGEYDQSPDEMQNQIQRYLDQNLVNIIGGCCGTTPEHIAKIVAITANSSPRKINLTVDAS